MVEKYLPEEIENEARNFNRVPRGLQKKGEEEKTKAKGQDVDSDPVSSESEGWNRRNRFSINTTKATKKNMKDIS